MTILLIDEDGSCRAALARALTESGWQVLEADDGEIGVNLALVNKPAVIVADMLTPRCNGFQICRTLRGYADRIGRPRIILTTGSGYATDRLNAVEAGADDYVVKPIRTAEFLQLLARGARGDRAAGAPGDHSSEEEPDATRLRFWGVRGSIATPGPTTVHYGGNTACIEVRAAGELIVLDAGTGIRPFGAALLAETGGQPIRLTVLISHTHWDHIQGFPFFVPAYDPKNRIRILGYEGARRGLETTLSGQMESPYFPISMQQMPGNILIQELRELKFEVGKVPVQAMFLNHPGICTGYRLFAPGGSIAYLPDVEPYQRFNAQKGAAPADEETQRYVRSQEQKLVEFIRDTDLAIVDAQYDAEEYERHVGWGHSSVDDSVRLALRAGVKHLFLFHHDPAHDDAKIGQMVESGRELVERLGGRLRVDAAREGLEVVLHPATPAV